MSYETLCMDMVASAQRGYFTTRLPADDYLWTAGFFNERFPDVVSPLGWSVVRRLVELSAFREPLSFLGYRLPEDFPITKLYRGHVYANVGVFQRLYRLFPQALLPQDAGRYFPHADTSLRYAVPLPPPARFLQGVLRTLATESGWHPFNYVAWHRFVESFDLQVADCVRQIEADGRPAVLLEQVDRLMDASLELLRLHRWSLTYAEVLYELLQHLVSVWVDAGAAREISAILVSGLPNKSTETDIALWCLAQQATRTGLSLEGLDAAHLCDLQAERLDAFLEGLEATPAGRQFQQAFRDFLARYGHRSPSLDLWYPAYADDPTGVLAPVARLLNAGGDRRFSGHLTRDRSSEEEPLARERAQEQRRLAVLRRVRQQLGGFSIRWWAFRLLLWLTQQYTILREDQRFYWQKSMHAKRRAFLSIGRAWAAEGVLARDDDIFFLTLSEIRGVVRGWLRVPEIRDLAQDRRAEFEALRGSGASARGACAQKHASYPAFLRGGVPLDEDTRYPDRRSGAQHGTINRRMVEARDRRSPRADASRVPRQLLGLPASPGRVRGPALVVSGPAVLHAAWRRASSGSILVASSTDPAWTSLFLRVAGLVMERGGQLSHGAVVAREYGLPAVVGVAGALEHIADGQIIEVDGSAGTVTLLEA